MTLEATLSQAVCVCVCVCVGKGGGGGGGGGGGHEGGSEGYQPRVLVVEGRLQGRARTVRKGKNSQEGYLPGVLVWMCYNGELSWVLPPNSV